MNAPAPRSAATRDPNLDGAALKADAERRQALLVARYRAAHAGATGSAKAIACLAEMEIAVRRAPEPSLGPPAWWREKHARTVAEQGDET